MNETLRDELWSPINIDRSVIVLDQEEAERLGLEDTEIFVWNPTKRVYVVNAFHQQYFAFTVPGPRKDKLGTPDCHV